MLQELRNYWLPLLLFAGTLLAAAVLLVLVAAMPFVADYVVVSNPALALFVDDVTVRRTAIAGAIGLIVTAWVFFRPNGSAPSPKPAAKKTANDKMAGA